MGANAGKFNATSGGPSRASNVKRMRLLFNCPMK
jgi:hypothetical protein